MRLVIQRVGYASVTVENELISEIGSGLMILVGVETGDTEADADWLVQKTVGMRIFPDSEGVMNCSVLESGGELMAVSQFTLTASTRKGNRPSYIRAAKGDEAKSLYDYFCSKLSAASSRAVAKGIFGADMKVAILNDGPVTIIIDSRLKE